MAPYRPVEPPPRRPSGPLLMAGMMLLATALASCSGEPAAGRPAAETTDDIVVPSIWADPSGRLGELLARGQQAGELELVERMEVEALVTRLLPDVGEKSWRVLYIDLPAGDLVDIELLESADPKTLRELWIHWVYRGEGEAAVGFDAEPLAGHPVRRAEGHHLVVRVGRVELLVVPESLELGDEPALRRLLERFDLETIAGL